MSFYLRILYVDDDPEFAREEVEAIGREHDRIEIVSETSPADALDRLAESPAIGCVVSGYDMSEMDGLELLDAVRESYPDLPFVLLTGDGSETVASEAIARGATDYIPKDTATEGPDRLLARIEAAVDRHRPRQRIAERERITDVLRTVSQALVRASSRGEIERAVCERVTEFEPYLAACVGTVETAGDVSIRVRRGDDDPFGRSQAVEPLFTSARGRSDLVVQSVETESRSLSAAAVPLVHEGEQYGVFAVATGGSRQFDRNERNLLTVLGDDIAHALHTQRIQSDLRTTASRLEALFENSPDMIDIHDADGTIMDVNARFAEKLGYESSELLGTKIWEVDEQLTPTTAQSLWEQLSTGDRYRIESRYKRKDGSTFPVEVHIRRLEVAGSDRFLVGSRDISDRKERERELRRYEDLVETMPVPIFRTKTDGEILEINDAFAEQFGAASVEEMADHSATEIWVDVADRNELIERAKQERTIQQRLSRMQTLDGDPLWIEVTMTVTEGEDEPHLVGICHDVTDRERRKRELRRSERQFEAMFHDPNILVGLLDTDGTVRNVNETAMRYIDTEREAVIGEQFTETPWIQGDPDIEAEVSRLIDRAAGGEYVEFTIDLTDALGDQLVIEGSVRPVTDDDGEVVSVLISDRDVTKRAERERELAESKARYESLTEDVLDTSEVGTFVLDDSLDIVWLNEAAERYFGIDREDVLGRSQPALVTEQLKHRVEDSERYEHRLLSTYETNTDTETFECHIPGDGQHGKRWLKHWSTPIESGLYEGGRIEHYTDITDRKQRDEQLRVMDRVLRHNLENEMNVVLGYASIIRRQATNGIRAEVDHIIDSGQRLLDVTDKQREIVELLSKDPDTTTLDAIALIEECADQVAREYPDFDPVLDIPNVSVEIRAIPQLRQAVHELMENAVVHTDDPEPMVSIGATPSGEHAQIRIADRGPGIPEVERAVLLGEGEQGPLYHGSGMGLWLVNWIVTYSSGSINYSEDNGGIVDVLVPTARQ